MIHMYKKGLTLLEIMIVIGAICILAAVVLPQFYAIRQNQVLKAATEDVVSAVDKARSQTLASFNSSEYGVHFQSDRIIIFKGTTFSSGATTNETIMLTSPATLALSGMGANVYFVRLTGEPSTTGSVIISNGATSKTITISATGAASIN